jgi:selenobiotic family peptide radical SAM maturase
MLKMTTEGISLQETAKAFDLRLSSLQRTEAQALRRGLLLAPQPRLQRQDHFAVDSDQSRLSAGVFTLQWHITQACDLNCKHCYDRSSRTSIDLEQARTVLNDFQRFCASKRVRGRITLSGGNPLMHPQFEAIYAEAAERGFPIGILGNPAPEERIRSIMEIQQPSFYQVSLEGLEAHNDHIRQPGHFNRVLDFLDLLQELGLESQVMLTLTRDNMQQVLPLAEQLRGRTGTFSFNRLSPVGEGSRLLLPGAEEFTGFLYQYLEAARHNPVLGLKDNLLNIARLENGQPAFGGCTGFGCGAAFNFLALLPDGEVHACRKFPSFLGNAYQQSLESIYDSAASTYRAGSAACRGCELLDRCGGCQAVVSGLGLDASLDRDPYCFFRNAPASGQSGGRPCVSAQTWPSETESVRV